MGPPLQHLALMEATVALAMIYKKFTFRMAYVTLKRFSTRPYRYWTEPDGVA